MEPEPRPGSLGKLARTMLLSVLLYSTAPVFGQDAFPPASVQYGFQDNIHTQLTIMKEINPMPQGQRPHRLWIVERSGWLEFDPAGQLIESGKVDAAGNHLQTEHYQYDEQANVIEKTITEGEKTTCRPDKVARIKRPLFSYWPTLESKAATLRSFPNPFILKIY